ncbi:MAG: ABC transporter ATP-binding protein [Firmicutes bacterium]|nr:ABC transporter ATP-binding protein [Bacillota bacterium]
MSLLEVHKLNKKYSKNFYANKDVSFCVNEGEIFGILGPNGAGKTTLVKQITTLLKPTSGNIKINGMDITDNPQYARKMLSLQPQTHIPIDGLTPQQILSIVGELRGGRRKEIEERIEYLFDRLQITDWSHCPSSKLSGGIKRLVSFALSVIVLPKLVILDEPTNDVDPARRKFLWEMVKEISQQGSSVLLITHNVNEAEKIIDRLAIMNNSRIIKTGRLSEIRKFNENILVLDLWVKSQIKHNFPEYFNVYYSDKFYYKIYLNNEQVLSSIKWLNSMKEKMYIDEYKIGPITLEDAYLKYVGEKKFAGC